MRGFRWAVLVLGVAASTVPAHAHDAGAGAAEISLEALFGGDPAELRVPEVGWRPGHKTLTWIEPGPDGGPTLVELDPATGASRTLLDRARLAELRGQDGGDLPTSGTPIWRPDGTAVLMVSNGDHLLIDLEHGELRVLDAGDGDEDHAEFSPDGRRIAWVRHHDLWVYDLEADREIRLSSDGSDTVFNGRFDWVYEEELAGRDGRAFTWSADGTAIVWLRLDDSAIPVHHLVDLTMTHSKVTEQRYPTPGDPSPTPSLLVVRFDEAGAAGEPAVIVFDPPIPYVPRFGFTPGGDLWYQVIDRSQRRLELIRVGLTTGDVSVLVEERDPHWVEPVNGLRFLDDESFLWLSRRDGAMHLYRIHPDGRAVDLSPGPGEVTELVGVDPAQRTAWYQAARPTARERRLYRVELTDGSTTELSTGAGTHEAVPSPEGHALLVGTSSLEAPERRWVTDGDGERFAEVVVHDPRPTGPPVDHRLLRIAADDGLELDAVLLLPPTFDDSRRHPVVVFTYGGPHAQVARDVWPGTSGLFNRYLTSRGFVVFAVDNRGSAARGRDFEGAVKGGLGSTQLPDQLAGVRWLAEQPWVDPDRIGIWGWSYGGYMACYALTHAPGTFAAGVAVAPVTDWRLYDSVYTERYMGTPEDNPAGYAAGSVLEAVADLSDPLLVIHGTGDDNVHFQHTAQLADRAWRAGARFDLVLFPGLTHGIRARGSYVQVFGAIADFFEEHLKTGGAAENP